MPSTIKYDDLKPAARQVVDDIAEQLIAELIDRLHEGEGIPEDDAARAVEVFNLRQLITDSLPFATPEEGRSDG